MTPQTCRHNRLVTRTCSGCSDFVLTSERADLPSNVLCKILDNSKMTVR